MIEIKPSNPGPERVYLDYMGRLFSAIMIMVMIGFNLRVEIGVGVVVWGKIMLTIMAIIGNVIGIIVERFEYGILIDNIMNLGGHYYSLY